jgi:hypothetical protein
MGAVVNSPASWQLAATLRAALFIISLASPVTT